MSPSPFAEAVQLVSKALSPLPTDPFKPGNDESKESTGLLQDIQTLGLEDYKTLNEMLNASVSGESDDNTLLMERTINLLSKLPEHSREGQILTDGFVNTLWGSLEHPPSGTLSKDARHRAPDGSNNNIGRPAMGAAGTPYARTTRASVFQGPNLPEPGLIFDSLMNRGDGSSFQEHPSKLSSMMFYLAMIITHDLFQTVSSS